MSLARKCLRGDAKSLDTIGTRINTDGTKGLNRLEMQIKPFEQDQWLAISRQKNIAKTKSEVNP